MLTAPVTGGASHDALPPSIALRIHDTEAIDSSAAPFVPIACALAAWSDATVHVVGPVSRGGADAGHALLDELSRRFGAGRARIVIDGVTDVEARPSGGSTPTLGLFYTRGIDSASTLIAERTRITTLLGLDWVDPPYGDLGQADIWRGTERAAAEEGLPLLRFSSNVRQLLDPIESWSHTHALVLIALAQLVSPRLDRVLLSGAHRRDVAPVDFGNAPDVVNRWRTGSFDVRSFDAADGRTAKTALVGADEHARRHLLVCWEQPGDRNCGRCLKCVQTMSHAHAAGVLAALQSRFEHPLTTEAVESLVGRPCDDATLAVLRELVDDLAHDPLASAWRRVITAAEESGRQVDA